MATFRIKGKRCFLIQHFNEFPDLTLMIFEWGMSLDMTGRYVRKPFNENWETDKWTDLLCKENNITREQLDSYRFK